MFEALFDQSPIPCAIVVHGQSHLRCNNAFARLLGYRKADLERRPQPPLLSDASPLESGPARNGATIRLKFAHKDGHLVELNCVTAPLVQGRGSSGTILQITNFLPEQPAPRLHIERPNPTLADLAIDHIEEAVYLIAPGGPILDANKAACDVLGYTREELARLSLSDIDPDFDAQACALDQRDKSAQCQPILDTRHRKKNGETFPVRISSVMVHRDGNSYLLAFALDISEEKRLEDLRLNVLESLARGDSKQHSLQLIVDYVEALYPEAIASIMLVSDDGTYLEPGPANKLPPWYLEATRRIPIGDGCGACGTAAAIKRAVQVEDIASHPYFDGCRDILLSAGLRSCWSDPILGADGEVLGTFCIYLNSPGQPSEIGVKTNARRASYFASIALERHRAEQRIRDSQQRYRDIFDNALDALALLETTDDRRYVIVEANPTLEKTVGIPRDRIVGRTTEEIAPMSVELAERINTHYRQCLASGEVVEGEARFDLPGGPRIMHSTMVPVLGPDGDHRRIVLISRDITEHRRAEKLLHTREQEFRALVENSPDGIMRYDRDGTILYSNPQARELIGNIDSPCGRIDADRFDACIATADRHAYREARRTVQETGTEAHLVIRLEATETRCPKHQDVRFVPEFSPEGDVRSVLSVMRDITTLKETEIQLRTLIENSPNYIARYTPQGELLYANPALRIWLGLNLDMRLAGLRSCRLPGREIQLVLAAIGDATKNECMVEREIHFSSSQEWHRILFVPEKNESGEFTSVLSVGQDITRQKHIDHELRESRTLLRELGVRRESELEAERKRIAHEIHDELGQLLTTLRLNLSLTGTLVNPEDERVRKKLADMTRLVDRTIQTVRNIATSLRPAVLNAGIASALEWLVQEFASHSGIQCHLSIPEDTELDEARATVVFRVVQESLSNIGRHSGADRVWIKLQRHVTGYCLTIRDNGRGFDTEAVSSQQSFGLIGMQERVLSLGGRLNLDSAPDLGTRIEIIIPVHPRRKAS